MAGDWIKIEHVTPDKPEVVRMSSALRIDQDAVTGKLLRVWIWADQNSVDGNDVTITEAFIDRLTARKGFAAAMRAVGWLTGGDGALTFPNFDRQNGQTAKARAASARRMAKSRASRCGDVAEKAQQKPQPEKRREEKSNTSEPPLPPAGGEAADAARGKSTQPTGGSTPQPPPDIPALLRTAAFAAAWAEWVAYRRARKLPAWKPVTVRAKLDELAGWGESAARESIRQSIANGYNGLFPPKNRPNAQTLPTTRTDARKAEIEAALGYQEGM